MLRHLSIRQFVLIDRLEMPVEPGFLAITGETGAGKSIVLDALTLLAGGRAGADFIRSGEQEASVQGLFEPGPEHQRRVAEVLREAGLPEAASLLVRRVLSRSGSNRVYINDALTTVALLQRLVGPMVEVVAQHDQLELTRPETHRRLLDRFGEHDTARTEMAAAYQAWADARGAIRALEDARAARSERLEFLRFQLQELSALALVDGEYDALDQALGRVRNAGKIQAAVARAREQLYDGDSAASDAIATTVEALRRVDDAALTALADRLEDAAVIVEDVGRELSRFGEGLDDELDLDTMEARHEALRSAMKRFATDEAGLLTRQADLAEEVRTLEHFEESWDAAAKAEKLARDRAVTCAQRLHAARVEASERFFVEAGAILAQLGLEHARFRLQADTTKPPTKHGFEPVEIWFSANPGEAEGPMAKVASGGELSRLLLALKSVAMRGDPVATYVFDEVDTGIGGATADIVAGLLRQLGEGRQVLCVTHLAQIAARADHHRHVTKRVEEGRTFSTMFDLVGDERVEEIARMVGGATVSEATRAHARALVGLSGP
jgi:DNA repair protein RecN (Recombination protein N)